MTATCEKAASFSDANRHVYLTVSKRTNAFMIL